MPKRPYQVAAIPASYFGGPGFETRPVNRIYRRVFFLRFYEVQEIITFKQIWMLSHIFQLIITKIILTRQAMYVSIQYWGEFA